MITGFWNIKGLNQPLKQAEVCNFIRKHDINIFAVLECKIDDKKAKIFMDNKIPTWRQVNNFNLHTPGRIMVMWDPRRVEATVIHMSPQVIHLEIKCKHSGFCFMASYIYGLHTMSARKPLWEFLEDSSNCISIPWAVMGDFNSVLYDNERMNGSAISLYETRDFFNCITMAGLTDMPSSGNHLTWTNGRILSKLDRALANDNLMISEVNVHATFLQFGYFSDHAPCLVNINQHTHNRKRMFKFFDMWMGHDTYLDVIRQNWTTTCYGTQQYILCRKLKNIKKPLRMLNKEHFLNIEAKAANAKAELQDLYHAWQQQAHDRDIQERIKEKKRLAWQLADAARKFIY